MATEVKKLNEETSDLPKLSEGVIEKIHGGKCEGLTGRIQVYMLMLMASLGSV